MNYLQLPIEVLPYVRRLSAVQLTIWADAWTWQQQGRKAYRTNRQLAEMLGVKEKAISTAISNLRSSGLVSCTMANGRQRFLTAIVPEPPTERGSNQTSTLPLNDVAESHSTSTHPPTEHLHWLPPNEYQVKKYNREVSKSLSKEVVLPFEGDEFQKIWDIWIQERKDRRIKKYTPRGEQAALHQLQTLSNNDEQQAIRIIQQSIANGWQGLFPLKTSTARDSNQDRQPSVTPEEFARLVTKKYH